jgi:hypothetical protein
MTKPKVKAVRIELMICLLAPIVVLVLIALPGFGYVRQLRQEVDKQAAFLDKIPLQESRLKQAAKVLSPYRMLDGGKDLSGELSLQVSQAGTDKGVTIKSVNAEKVVPSPNPAFLEYRITMAGEGSLGAFIRTLEELSRPVKCHKVASLRLRAKTFIPQTIYDVDTVFVSDSLVSLEAGVSPLSGSQSELLARLREGTLAVEAKANVRPPVLDTRKIDRRKIEIKDEVAPVISDEAVGFRVTGIIQDKRDPLVLLDRGVFGVGDTVDGYKIVNISKDHIVVVGRQGRQELIPLYKNEAKP